MMPRFAASPMPGDIWLGAPRCYDPQPFDDPFDPVIRWIYAETVRSRLEDPADGGVL